MKIQVQDIVSYQGRDWTVQGLVTYKLGARTLPLARLVDGADVRWLEPLVDELDDRILWLTEVSDLDIAIPPPSSIDYHGTGYVPRFSGTATVALDGRMQDRSNGTCELWRYRGPGDVYLQIESWPDRTVVLTGESVHKGMIDILPAA